MGQCSSKQNARDCANAAQQFNQRLEALQHTGSPYAPRVFLASRGFPDWMRIWSAAGMSHRETNVSCRASTLHARFSRSQRLSASHKWKLPCHSLSGKQGHYCHALDLQEDISKQKTASQHRCPCFPVHNALSALPCYKPETQAEF